MNSAPEERPACARKVAEDIVRRLQAAGHEACLVGGCVRDLLLGRAPADFDVATSARPEQIEQVFAKTIPVGRQFGVIVVVDQEVQTQVATFRADGDYRDGRRPSSVTFGNARADALRRDFTVNGLFYDPVKGETHDWVGGKQDLDRKLIRTIGQPEERFGEDFLRLLRAVRFAAQLDFDIESQTLAAIQKAASNIKQVSAERIRDELLKLFQPRHAAHGLDLLRESGLMEHALPELIPTITSEQSPEYHPEGTVYEHLRLMLRLLPPNSHPLLPWAVLLHDIAKPATFSQDPATGRIHNYGHEILGAEMAEQLLTRLRFSRKQIDLLVCAVRNHMEFRNAMKMKKSKLRRMLLRPDFDFELELHKLDCLGSHRQLDTYEYIGRELVELGSLPQIKPPLINGDDLLKLGMTPGPAMGRLLAEIRDKQLAEELVDREQALEFARGRLNLD